jgi:hypothetical protein
MFKFAILNEDGTVQSLGANLHLPAGAVAVNGTLETYAAMMFVDGVWAPRPAPDEPVITGNILRFEGLPDGASCEIRDLDFNYIAGQVDAVDGVIEFQISDAGTYQLEVSAPLPWLSKTINVVIA